MRMETRPRCRQPPFQSPGPVAKKQRLMLPGIIIDSDEEDVVVVPSVKCEQVIGTKTKPERTCQTQYDSGDASAVDRECCSGGSCVGSSGMSVDDMAADFQKRMERRSHEKKVVKVQ